MITKRSALMVLLFFLPATAFAAKRYVVKQGDNLSNLAKKFHVSFLTIKNVNGLSNDRLNVGDAILIPDSENDKASVKQNTGNSREFGYSARPVASTTEGKQKELTENQITLNRQYVVAQNDTLSGIGKKFGVSPKDLIKQNNLKNINLQVGQRLIIPSLSESDKIPLVAAYISLANGASISYNDDLAIGSYLCRATNEEEISSTKGLVEAKEKESIVTKVNISSAPAKYVVKKGDTLSEIANQFGASTQEIERVNGIKNDRLKIGVSLEIPNSGGRAVARSLSSELVKVESQKVLFNNKPREYFVENGDTLSGIGKKFGVSVNDLKNANSMRSDDLRIGARVIVPGAFSTSGETKTARENKPVSLNINETTRYVVKKGDNLTLIAKRFNVSVEDLKNTNHIKGRVRIGQAISIPTQSKSAKLNVEDINAGRDQYKTDVQTSLKAGTDNNQENGDEIGDISRDSIIKVAMRFIGVPYKFGGTSLIKGLDCSAFVAKVFSFLNVDLPRTARELFGVGRSVDRNQLAAGDLVFFRTYASYPSHVGIYMGSSEFIHASPKARMVTIDSMNRAYFTKRYIGARRIEKAGLFYEELSHDYRGFER